MKEMFEDIQKIRKDNHLIMVANGKLVQYTGSIQEKEIQALIGMAVKRKFLKFESKDQSGAYVLHQGDKHAAFVKNAKKISGCHAKALAYISGNGQNVLASPICHQQGQVWKSFALIGELAISDINMHSKSCNQMHLNEQEIGLEFAKQGQKVVSSSGGGW